MKAKEKLEVIKHIKLGTNEVLYYPYNEGKEPLPLRPISSFEFDQCLYYSLEFAPERIAEFVVKLKLNLINKNSEIPISDKNYAKLQAYYDRVDYWVVYHAMKDFQDDWFKKPDYTTEEAHPKGYYQVLKMRDVHEIAQYVLNTSYKPKEVIEEVFKDEIGREVAYCYYYLNIPLSSMDKMTKLQRDYLVHSKGNLRKISKGKAKEDKYSITGKKMTVKDFMERVGVGYS